MKRIVLANLASPANPGDQAILRGSLKLLRECFGDPEITLSTRAISEKKVYEKLGCRVVASYPDVDKLNMEDSLRKVLCVPQTLFGGGPLREAVKNSDAVFLAGGAYFYSYRKQFPGLTYLAHLSAGNWAHRYGKPVYFLPQSYGPFCSQVAANLFGGAVKKATAVFYREEISGAFLRKHFPESNDRMIFSPDLALYLEPSDLLKFPRSVKTRPMLGVTVRPWEAGSRPLSEYLSVLENVLCVLAREWGALIRIVVQVQDVKSGEGDEFVSRDLEERLVQKLGRDGVEYHSAAPYFDLESLCTLYAECDLMLSMRLHSALLSLLTGCPAVTVGYQHKAEGILRSLGLSGLYAGNYDALGGDSLLRQVQEVWRNRESWKIKINEALAQARATIKERLMEKLQ